MSSNPRVDLSLEQLFRLQDGELTLEELFADDDVYAEPGANLRRMLRRARYKVLQGFRNAVDDKLRPTDSYIMNCGPSCDELVAVIAALTKQGPWLVRRRDFARDFRNLPDKRYDTVAAYARQLLLARVLTDLMTDAPGREALVWYMRGERTWQARQSLMDEWDDLRREMYGRQHSRPKRATKADIRPFHGRPGRDRSRNRGLGIAPGVSVGASR
jgi:hypothetical protein